MLVDKFWQERGRTRAATARFRRGVVRSFLTINARLEGASYPTIRLMALMTDPCALQGHTASTAQMGRSLAVSSMDCF